MIDQWRRRKGTALNQSAAGISRGSARLRLERRVTFEAETVVVEDRLTGAGPQDAGRLFLVLDGPVELEGGGPPDEDRRIPLSLALLQGRSGELRIRKRFLPISGGVAVRIEP
jgi:hypothetical protein